MEQKNSRNSAAEVQKLLKEKTRQIEKHLQALKDEVTNFTPSVRSTINKHPLVAVGGAMAAGILVGIALARQRGVPYSQGALDAYLAPVAATIKARMDTGESADDAVRAALRGQLPPPAPAASSVSHELVRLLVPILAGWAVQTFTESGNDSNASKS